MTVKAPGQMNKVVLRSTAEAYRLAVYVNKSRHIVLYVYFGVALPVAHDLITFFRGEGFYSRTLVSTGSGVLS